MFVFQLTVTHTRPRDLFVKLMTVTVLQDNLPDDRSRFISKKYLHRFTSLVWLLNLQIHSLLFSNNTVTISMCIGCAKLLIFFWFK